MDTIWNTEELIKRTKKHVENIPVKTEFYQSVISESRRSNNDYIDRERYFSENGYKKDSPGRKMSQRL